MTKCNAIPCYYGKTLTVCQLEMSSFITSFSFAAFLGLLSLAGRRFLTKEDKRQEERVCHYKWGEVESHFGLPLSALLDSHWTLNWATFLSSPFHCSRHFSCPELYIHKLLCGEQLWTKKKKKWLSAYDKLPEAVALGCIIIINELDHRERQRGLNTFNIQTPWEEKRSSFGYCQYTPINSQ